MIRVILVDDQVTVRHGLRMRLMLEPDIQVVGEAGNGGEALKLATLLSPDVILIDIAMPGMDGIATTEAMRANVPRSAVVILSLYGDGLTRARAQAAGAVAFVEKQGTTQELLMAIRQVAQTDIPGRAEIKG